MLDFEFESVSVFGGKLLGVVSVTILVDGEIVGWINRIAIFDKNDCPGEYHASITWDGNKTHVVFAKEHMDRIRAVAIAGYIRAKHGQREG